MYLSDYKKSGKSDVLSLKKAGIIKSTSKINVNSHRKNEKGPRVHKEPPLINDQFFDCQDLV